MKKHQIVLMAFVLLVSACGPGTPTPIVPVIDVNPKDLLIGADSLPAGGNYGNGIQRPYPNDMFNNEYVKKSGRVDGSEVIYSRGANFSSPLTVVDEAILYKNAEGAKYSLEKYFPNLCAGTNYKIVKGYRFADGALICTQELNNPGVSQYFYWIYFIYKNVGHLITGSGQQAEVKPEFMLGLAQSALQTLQKIPLSNSITFTP